VTCAQAVTQVVLGGAAWGYAPGRTSGEIGMSLDCVVQFCFFCMWTNAPMHDGAVFSRVVVHPFMVEKSEPAAVTNVFLSSMLRCMCHLACSIAEIQCYEYCPTRVNMMQYHSIIKSLAH
jgi:hypothetical protein